MKLIRDIISEKRQLASHAIQEPETERPDGTPGEKTSAQDAMIKADDSAPKEYPDTPAKDGFAAFFAENDEPFALDSDQMAEPLQVEDRPLQVLEDAPADRPSKLVLGKAFALDTGEDQIPQTDIVEEVGQDARPVEAFESSPVEEQDSGQSLKDVFRDLNTAEDASAEVEQENDPASDAERHVADLLDVDAVAEPQQERDNSSNGQPEAPVAAPPPPAARVALESVEVPKPASGRGMSRHGRVKTRLLGFNTSMNDEIDPMKDSEEAKPAAFTKFPVGWLIVVEGEGRGSAFSLFNGVSNIGRGTDQTVCLDFGDNSISRDAHASIAYDPRQQSFFIGHCGKANIVRRNDRPILSTEELEAGDHITIGETVLRFVPLCGPDFSWESAANTSQAHAANG